MWKKVEFNEWSLIELLNKNFKDIRFNEFWRVIVEWIWKEEEYELEWFTIDKFKEFIFELSKKEKLNSIKSKEEINKYFSFFIKKTIDWKPFYQWYRWVFKESIRWKEITVRKMTWKVKIEDIIKDEKLLDILLDSFTTEKSLVVSWRPWSWKSTILISALEFFNNNTYNELVVKLFFEIVLKVLYWNIELKNDFEIENFIEKYFDWDKEFAEDKIKYFFKLLSKIMFNESKLKKIYELNYFLLLLESILDFKIDLWLPKDEYKTVFELLKIMLFDDENKEIIVNNTIEYFKQHKMLKKLKNFNKLWLKNINTLEAPVEYLYQKNYLRFYQHDVETHFWWK